jgi:serine/threonine-protein kinase
MDHETSQSGEFRPAGALVGKVLKGKWQLDKLLGVGGMAVVYAATHHRNGQRVAVKMLHPEGTWDADLKARFLREGYLANSVDHEGRVQVFDDDVTEEGVPFLVMELLEGETVDRRWKRDDGKLPLGQVLGIAEEILDVLAAAHDKGIVHRDIKPENIFLTRGGKVKILDFGIAGLLRPSTSTTTTQRGVTMGTPSFMSPEQARGRWEEVDARSDLWALGATMFTLLSGRHVHEAETPNELLLAAMTAPAEPIERFVPSLPPEFAAIIDKALMSDRAARWQDARAMQSAIRDACAAMNAASSVPFRAAWTPEPAPTSATADDTIATAPLDLKSLPPTSTGKGVVETLTDTRKESVDHRPRLKALAALCAALGAVAAILFALGERPSAGETGIAPPPATAAPSAPLFQPLPTPTVPSNVTLTRSADGTSVTITPAPAPTGTPAPAAIHRAPAPAPAHSTKPAASHEDPPHARPEHPASPADESEQFLDRRH